MKTESEDSLSNWMKTARAQAVKSPTPLKGCNVHGRACPGQPLDEPCDVRTWRTWSTKQEAIFAWFAGPVDTSRALVVMARAGTGKTTAIIEAIDRAPEERILLAAFNKSIAEELKARITNPNAEAKTLHSVGFSIIRQTHPQCRVEQHTRAWKLAMAGTRAIVNGPMAPKGASMAEVPDGVVRKVSKLHSKAREMSPYAQGPEDLRSIAEQFECEPDPFWVLQGWDLDFVLEAAYEAMVFAVKHYDTIDFADMIYLPLRNHWAAPQYDLVVVDEAQDMTRAQLDLARAVLEPGGRMVLVGDDKQAIYAFRGADSGSLGRLGDELQAHRLPLNITYRCGKAIVAEAQTLVPDFEASPYNNEGVVDAIGVSTLVKEAKPGDFILSRRNAPLAELALTFIRNDVPAEIKGRDIADGLRAVIGTVSKNGGSAVTIRAFLDALVVWRIAEVDRLLRLKFDQRASLIVDQYETISALCEGCTSVADVSRRVDRIFTDEGPNARRVLLSSVHKAKGLEANRVFVLDWTLCRTPTHQNTNMDEERNIIYVAITRARAHLTYVHRESI